jgi:ABC-type multidrug transport system ATPase subunit
VRRRVRKTAPNFAQSLRPSRRRELIEAFGLDPAKKARAYSKGNRQQVAPVAALASDAELLLLDEPAAGRDPLRGHEHCGSPRYGPAAYG